MFWIICGAIVFFLMLVLLTAYICYRMAFYVKRDPHLDESAIPLPEGEIYKPFHEKMTQWVLEARAMPHEDVSVQSFDGLKLQGRYYESVPGAPIELMFHGYRGTSEKDLSGGVQRCFALGRNALIVDQRSCGRSEGHATTFGVLESRDCHTWLQYMTARFGPDVRIILTGISMGAATVLMAAGRPLPPQVIGVLADCGYTSAREIISLVIRQMGLPEKVAYPFVRLGARLYGHFDLEELPPITAMAQCQVPVIFFHGEADDFVPCDMSRRNYEACISRKRLVTVRDAGHGLAYPVDREGYLQALREFFGE